SCVPVRGGRRRGWRRAGIRRRTSRLFPLPGVFGGTETLRDANRTLAKSKSRGGEPPGSRRFPGRERSLRGESHLGDELLDAATNLVTDRTDRFDVETRGVVEDPFLVALPWID